MIFRTDITGRRTVEEFLECRECNNQMFSDYDTCTECKGEELVWMSGYTVYMHVYATDADDAIETALNMNGLIDWQAANGKIIIESERKSKLHVLDTAKLTDAYKKIYNPNWPSKEN